MITREQVVSVARSYVDTPFQHQGRVKGVGIDCVGLLIGVAHELGITDFDIDGYSVQPSPEMFRRVLREQMDEKQYADRQLGDALSFAFLQEQHVGIITALEPLSVVHCWSKVGRCIEHSLDALWLRRVRGCWSYRLAP